MNPFIELLESQMRIYVEERTVVQQPLREKNDRIFAARAGPLIRTRGIPTKSRLKQKYPDERDYVLLELRYDSRFCDWIAVALFGSFASEAELIEFCLKIPFGLRYIIESVAGIGTLEIVRRCRHRVASTHVYVVPMNIDYRTSNEGVPLLLLTPPIEMWGSLGTRIFFVQYLLSRPRECKAGLLEWMVTPPVLRIRPALPVLTEGAPVAIRVVRRSLNWQAIRRAERVKKMRALLRESFTRRMEYWCRPEGLLIQSLWEKVTAGEMEVLTAGEWERRSAERSTSSRRRTTHSK